jgi:hypothetical protein
MSKYESFWVKKLVFIIICKKGDGISENLFAILGIMDEL